MDRCCRQSATLPNSNQSNAMQNQTKVFITITRLFPITELYSSQDALSCPTSTDIPLHSSTLKSFLLQYQAGMLTFPIILNTEDTLRIINKGENHMHCLIRRRTYGRIRRHKRERNKKNTYISLNVAIMIRDGCARFKRRETRERATVGRFIYGPDMHSFF